MKNDNLKLLDVKRKTLISLRNVTYSSDGIIILENINFDIEEGCYLGIIGPNGAGKTTLLKLILGILKPTSGEIKIKGLSPEEYLKKQSIGYLPQRISQSLFEMPITVEELIRSGIFSPSEDLVNWALNLFNIYSLRKKSLRQLSGGERQKAFLARALVAKPKILLLDEPTTGIDPQARDELLEILERLNSEYGISLLVVTHDIATFAHESKCILCLNRKVVCLGEPQGILKEEYMKLLYPTHNVFHPKV